MKDCLCPSHKVRCALDFHGRESMKGVMVSRHSNRDERLRSATPGVRTISTHHKADWIDTQAHRKVRPNLVLRWTKQQLRPVAQRSQMYLRTAPPSLFPPLISSPWLVDLRGHHHRDARAAEGTARSLLLGAASVLVKVETCVESAGAPPCKLWR